MCVAEAITCRAESFVPTTSRYSPSGSLPRRRSKSAGIVVWVAFDQVRSLMRISYANEIRALRPGAEIAQLPFADQLFVVPGASGGRISGGSGVRISPGTGMSISRGIANHRDDANCGQRHVGRAASGQPGAASARPSHCPGRAARLYRRHRALEGRVHPDRAGRRGPARRGRRHDGRGRRRAAAERSGHGRRHVRRLARRGCVRPGELPRNRDEKSTMSSRRFGPQPSSTTPACAGSTPQAERQRPTRRRRRRPRPPVTNPTPHSSPGPRARRDRRNRSSRRTRAIARSSVGSSRPSAKDPPRRLPTQTVTTPRPGVARPQRGHLQPPVRLYGRRTGRADGAVRAP